jgi:opacity protein-like surface antigen
MKKIITVLVLLFLVSTTNIKSQISLQVGGGLGIISPSGDYSGSTVDFYEGTKYGMETGFNLHAKARVGLLGFNVFGMIDYSSLSNEGPGEPDKSEKQVENSHRILSLKVGPEFSLSFPMSPIGAYVDGFISLNTISGTVTFQGLSQVPSGEEDIESATRIGAGAGGGILFDITPLVTIDLGIHYNFFNLFGKEYSEVSTSHERLDVYTSLNDEKDPLYGIEDDHIVGDSRAMSAWQFTLTAMIGL